MRGHLNIDLLRRMVRHVYPHGSLVGLRDNGRLVVVREDGPRPGPGTVVALQGPGGHLVVGKLEKTSWAGWEVRDEFGEKQRLPVGPWRLRGEVVVIASVARGR